MDLEACARESEKQRHTSTLSAALDHFRMLGWIADNPVPSLSKKRDGLRNTSASNRWGHEQGRYGAGALARFADQGIGKAGRRTSQRLDGRSAGAGGADAAEMDAACTGPQGQAASVLAGEASLPVAAEERLERKELVYSSPQVVFLFLADYRAVN